MQSFRRLPLAVYFAFSIGRLAVPESRPKEVALRGFANWKSSNLFSRADSIWLPAMADKVSGKRSFSEVTTSSDNQAPIASGSDKIQLYSLATPNGQKVRDRHWPARILLQLGFYYKRESFVSATFRGKADNYTQNGRRIVRYLARRRRICMRCCTPSLPFVFKHSPCMHQMFVAQKRVCLHVTDAHLISRNGF
jgi:hypothetical protein